MPILLELVAVGGTDELRYLYERLIGYFPQLSDDEIKSIRTATNKNWRKAVQAAGKVLDEDHYLQRKNGVWTITAKGREIADTESVEITISNAVETPVSHGKIQNLLIEIGESLGFYAQSEFEYFDVIWRESANSQRISHIFEVQNKGNIDSAFAKLKRAYQSQRTKPFLVVASERDNNRARQSLNREFQDIESAVVILTFVQIEKIHRNLKSIGDILPILLDS